MLGCPLGDGSDVVESVGSGVCDCEPMTVGGEVGVGVVGSAELATDEGEGPTEADGAEVGFADVGPVESASPGFQALLPLGEVEACMSTGEVADAGAADEPGTLGAVPPAAIDDPDPPDPPAPIPEA